MGHGGEKTRSNVPQTPQNTHIGLATRAPGVGNVVAFPGRTWGLAARWEAARRTLLEGYFPMRQLTSSRFAQALVLAGSAWGSSACSGGGSSAPLPEAPPALEERTGGKYVEHASSEGAFTLSSGGAAAPIVVGDADFPGVHRVAGHLAADIARVSGAEPGVLRDSELINADQIVLAGTLGNHSIIDDLVASGKLDVTNIAGRWEAFVVQVVEQPLPTVSRALVIAGSDLRATLFGMYDLSKQIGVSPLHYWADVPVAPQSELFVPAMRYSLGEPAIKYRGIFINDEAPALSGWALPAFGGLNHEFYEKVFELLLRSKANYMWPAMWNNAFYADDAENAALAQEYGIIMGTSHHEPLTRAQQEWTRMCTTGCGTGTWDYDANRDFLHQFWSDALEARQDFQPLVTIGMRGDGDEPLVPDADVALLERIVAGQRDIIQQVTGDAAGVPQVWQLYKEVQTYYNQGMDVPDDVTLVFSDDNFGNVRQLPLPGTATRGGGYGMYYHFDFVGGPRNYKWLNTNSIPRIWEQMHKTYEHEVDRLWIVNVGDIKPMELPMQFFLDYAWRPEDWPLERMTQYTTEWAAQQFGPEHAAEIAHVLDMYTFYNARRKPELVDQATYSIVDFREAETVVAEYNALAAEAGRLEGLLPEQYRDAYYELVLYPVLASANHNEFYVTTGQNALYATQRRASTNTTAARVRELFEYDRALVARYHTDTAGGKWNGIAQQPHFGYVTWQDPGANSLPQLTELAVPAEPALGVAVEGSPFAWPGATGEPTVTRLSRFQSFPDRYVEVFNRGQGDIAFTVTSSAPWLSITPASGTITGAEDLRLSLSADWAAAPAGATTVPITISGAGTDVVVQVPVFNHDPALAETAGFVFSEGYVAMEAEHYTRAVGTDAIEWKNIGRIGRTGAGITPFPTNAPSQNAGGDTPHLEYQVNLEAPGNYRLRTHMSPDMPFYSEAQGLRFAVSIDDGPLTMVNLHTRELTTAVWEPLVRDNINIASIDLEFATAGEHVIKYWMVDPGVVLQKLVLINNALEYSFLGPNESYLRRVETPETNPE